MAMAMNGNICTSKFLCGDGRWRNPWTGDVLGEVKVYFRRFHRRNVSVRDCSSSCDGLSRKVDKIARKVHAITPKNHPQLVLQQRDHAVECSLVEHGKSVPCENLGCDIPRKRQVSDKLRVAVDVDEVLGSFLSALNRFLAVRYSLQHSVEEYYVYEFCKIWNCSPTEANIRVHEFFETPYFNMGINPISGAYDALTRLSTICSFSVVTSRQNAIKHQTIDWIQKHFPNMFDEIHFGNHFALDGRSKSKSEICWSVGAEVLIDDNPRYAVECAKAGIRVLLFDLNNSYPWSKIDSQELHPLVIKVHSWEEVEQQLTSLVEV